MHQSNKAAACLSALLLLFPAVGSAESSDRNEPIHLEADQVLLDDAKHTSTFTGNVQLTQGTLLIHGSKIILTQDQEGYQHATVYGDSAEFRQKREGLDEYIEGYGNTIEYDTRTEVLDLHEKARLKRNQDEVSGDHISYNIKTEIFRVNGGNGDNPPSQRVRAILQPKRSIAPPSSPAQ